MEFSRCNTLVITVAHKYYCGVYFAFLHSIVHTQGNTLHVREHSKRTQLGNTVGEHSKGTQ